MRQFDQNQLLSRMLQRGQVATSHIGRLTETAAEFHQQIADTDPSTLQGTPDAVLKLVAGNFEHLQRSLTKSWKSVAEEPHE